MVSPDLLTRAAMHAALGEPIRLAIVDELTRSDRSPKELADRFGLTTNLLAHHLDVLDEVGLITRSRSAGDGRRKYVRLAGEHLAPLRHADAAHPAEVLFLCSHNSARSQLAAALWSHRTGGRAASAGTHPAARIHRGALAAARRSGLPLDDRAPTALGDIPPHTQVITVCDRAHEELEAAPEWWHWSIPDPVAEGSPAAFDAVVADLDRRIATVTGHRPEGGLVA